jgi:RNA recognition motif-containing protein
MLVCRNSRTLVVAKLAPVSNGVSTGADGHRIKRQRLDQEKDEFFVKVERQQQIQQAQSQPNGADGVHEVRVSDLPWGVNQPEVESYFGVAGKVLSVRMPTMDDGSTVGVAIVRFGSLDGVNAALRMDGYHFQGRSIRVARPAAH